MMTLNQSLKLATQALDRPGIDTPRLDAEVLLMHVLGWTRAQLYTHPEHTLDAPTLATLESLIARRVQGAPVAYLTGWKEFFGLRFKVDRRVLIPRPETELLVERALAWSATLETQNSKLTIADIGTGSGAIAIALATHLPHATVFAIDTSASALQVAAENVRSHALADRVRLLQGDLLAPLPARVDLIVANLPYIPTAEIPGLPDHIRDYEPVSALDGGEDGLDVIRRLIQQSPEKLLTHGALMLEIGATQGATATALARQQFPTGSISIIRDYAGRDRVLEIQTGTQTRCATN